MADIYSHGTYSRNIPTQRKQHVTELYALAVEDGQADAKNNIVTNSIRHGLLIGIKDAKYDPYLSSVTFGKLATSGPIVQDPKYPMLGRVMAGVKQKHLEENVIFAQEELAGRQDKVLMGISIHGIGYKPPTVEPDKSEIRRWPRNWYGDNIKS